MRLIDADELICNLSDYALQEAPNDNMEVEEREYQQQIYEVITCCIDAVVEQPTAYDVDKVVEQLRKEFEKENESANDEMTANGHTLDFEYRFGRANAFIRSAEIVKAGGRE